MSDQILTADSILIGAADGRITWCNRPASELLGFEAGMSLSPGFAGRCGLSHSDGTAIPRFEDFILRHAFEGGRIESIELHLCSARTHNEIRRLRVSAEPVFAPGDDKNEKAQSVIAVFHDTTERARSEQPLRRLMDSNMVGIALWDSRHAITEANDAFYRILGRAAADAGTLRIDDLVAPEFAETAKHAFAEIGERGVCEPFQCEHLTASGARIPVLAGGASLDEGTGLLFALDISEQNKLEEKLRQTAKLESLGILASGIAHDFNNLLTGILGNATLALEAAPPGSSIAELLRSVVQAGESAGALAHQMLAYSGRGQFRIEHVDFPALVSETLTLIESALGRAVRVNVAITPALPPVEGDPSQLQQIVMNLAINAAEAVDNKGEVSVRTGVAELDGTRHPSDLALGNDTPPGRYVFLEVRDSGPGMDKHTLERIFDPFFTTKAAGRGLGLAAVLGIVRSHNGVIRVSSEPGSGTTFTVYLPASENPEPDEESDSPRASSFGGIILVVDDEAYVRETVRRSLEGAGYTVVSASGSAEALQLFQSLGQQIHLAIVDMTMPGESGDEVVRRLRHYDPKLKVIATSGYARSEVTAKFADLMDAFLPKPYGSDRLREIVASVLAG